MTPAFASDDGAPRWRRVFPARYAVLFWVAGTFIGLNTLVRLGLLVFEGDSANWLPARLLRLAGVGALYDLAAASYLLMPFALLALVWPNSLRGRVGHAVSASALLAVSIFGMLLVAASEGVFWNEYASRFNFIAVDYLVYTREVVGNIRQSYPLGWMLGGVFAAALLLGSALRGPVWRSARADAGGWRKRLVTSSAVVALSVLSFFATDDAWRESIEAPSARELAGNGYYDFMRALRSNDLDFDAFYRVLPAAAAGDLARGEFLEAGSDAAFVAGAHPLERRVTTAGPAKPMNVVLVSMESLGSDYVESFGGKPGLTPNLDRLGREGLMFTRVYATGLRTVRGLEALTLSIPPTPGHAVPMRKHNTHLQTVGGVFKEQGWQPLYLYGGYGYFDNMSAFFGGNGYEVIDRSDIAAPNVSHETIWGVADEDLFGEALRQIDRRTAAGDRVFVHVMTTSNHRPFTYPPGRVAIASGTGRDGAVAYADWAIGDFMRKAAARPWFANTVFVFVADHTSHGRGRTDLPPENYRIPLIVHAPGTIAPGVVDTLASQIDVAPTLLALLDVAYVSRFFGQDILTEGQRHQRAFMANYLTVGYMEHGLVAELSPKRRARVVDATSGATLNPADPRYREIVDETVAHYQVASGVVHAGGASVAPALALARGR